jgi:hypothetical protein
MWAQDRAVERKTEEEENGRFDRKGKRNSY